MIRFSSPGKIHLLGEHAVVYGKPALLTTVDLRVTVTLAPSVIASDQRKRGNLPTSEDPSLIVQDDIVKKLKKIIESIVKKELNIKTVPPYQLSVSSQLPIKAGLGSSAAVSASYIAALLTFLKVKWDLNFINNLTYEAEKVFHGNPSGGDNSAVVFGGLIWYRKETDELKLIHQLPYSIAHKIAKNFVLINTGTPKESTAQMVNIVSAKYKVQSVKLKKIFDNQEQLVKKLLPVLKEGNEKELIRIIREGEKNLESIGVVSSFVKGIIRKIENAGGAGKICGGGATDGPTGILLCYHPNSSVIKGIAKSYGLDYFKTNLRVEGLRKEND